MTTLEKIRAEIEKAKDRLRPDLSEGANAQYTAFHWVLHLIDKYADQEPCQVKNELNVELNELEPCDDADAEYDKAYDAYLALVNADVKEPRDDVFDKYGNYKYPSDVELTEPNTATSMPCDDVVSRQAVCDYIAEFVNHEYSTDAECEMVDAMIGGIQHMPSVRPQEQTGHWKRISMDRYTTHAQYWYECDKCGEHNLGNTDYCPSCGCRMVEPQAESEKI